MVIAPSTPGCTGTLVEHVIGPVECTDDLCSAAAEEHSLVIRCVDVVCACGRADRLGEAGGER